MTSVNIAIPDAAREFIDQQVAAGKYRNEGDYILSLIEADRSRRIRAQLEAEILRGLQTPSTPMTAEDWNEIRTEARRLLRSPTI